MRISDRLLVQPIDTDGIVVVDESSGEEVMIPREVVPRFQEALAVLAVAIGAPPAVPL